MATIESDGFEIESTTQTEASLRAAIGIPEDQDLTPETPESPEPTPEATEPEPETAKPDKKAKPRENMQARLSEQTQRYKAEKDRADRLAAELETARKPVERAPERTEKPLEAPKPSLAKVEYPSHLHTFDGFQAAFPDAQFEDYTDARADFRRERLSPRPDLSAAIQQELGWQATVQAHAQRCQQAKDAHPDYQERLDATDAALTAAGLKFSPVVQQAILSSEQSGEVMYYLGAHPDACLQLARETADLPVGAAPVIRSLLEGRLSAGAPSGAVLPPSLSTAKAPIKPVGSSPVTSPLDDTDDEPIEQFIARGNARDRKGGRF